VAALVTAALTGWLVLYGPEAVVVTTNEIRFSALAHGLPERERSAAPTAVAALGPASAGGLADRPDPAERGHIEHLGYTARALGDRPAVAPLYVPAHFDRIVRAGGRVPVVVFLHGIPGAPEDWLAGGGLADRLDEEIAAGRFPTALAVVPESATMHDPRAGWVDAPHQPVLRSLRTDLLPALARRFPAADLDAGQMAIVGVGRGADGALRLAGLDRRFGYAAAIGPKDGLARARRAAQVFVFGTAPSGDEPGGRSQWSRWRAELPEALRSLAGAGFGEPPPPPAPEPILARAGQP
jgi:hypothetical protein